MTETISFHIVGHGYSRKAGKDPVYKVNLKSADGDSLTLVGNSKQVYAGYPIGDVVTVKIEKRQRTLDQGPGE